MKFKYLVIYITVGSLLGLYLLTLLCSQFRSTSHHSRPTTDNKSSSREWSPNTEQHPMEHNSSPSETDKITPPQQQFISKETSRSNMEILFRQPVKYNNTKTNGKSWSTAPNASSSCKNGLHVPFPSGNSRSTQSTTSTPTSISPESSPKQVYHHTSSPAPRGNIPSMSCTNQNAPMTLQKETSSTLPHDSSTIRPLADTSSKQQKTTMEYGESGDNPCLISSLLSFFASQVSVLGS